MRGSYPDRGMIALPGRQRLEGWRRGVSPPPPLAHLTGARPIRLRLRHGRGRDAGLAWLAASNGLITGGTLAILADIAFGCSVETELPAATPYTTAELSLSFLRPARPGGMLSAGGQAIHVGRSVGLSEAFVLDRDTERLVAHGTSRLTIFPPIDPAPEPPIGPRSVRAASRATPRIPTFARRPRASSPQEAWGELPGAEILRRQLAGRLPPPPLHHLTGLRMTGYGERWATALMPSSEWLASPSRRIQGGAIAMLADFAMLIAVQTTTPAGLAFAGLDLKVNFLRPA